MDVLEEMADSYQKLGIKPPFKAGAGSPMDVRSRFSVDGATTNEIVSFGDPGLLNEGFKSDQENLIIRKKLDCIEKGVGTEKYKKFSDRIFGKKDNTKQNLIAVINTSACFVEAGQSDLIPVLLEILEAERFCAAEAPNDEEKSLSYRRQEALWNGEDLAEIEEALTACRERRKKSNRSYFSNILLLKIEELVGKVDAETLSTEAFASWLKNWLSRSKIGQNFDSIDQELSLIDEQTVKILILNNYLSQLTVEERRKLDVNQVFRLINHSRMGVSEMDEELQKKMAEVVSNKFLPGDGDDFSDEFLKTSENKVQFFSCGDELLTFFGEEIIDEDLDLIYLDWFNAVKNSVRGVSAQACMKAGVNSLIESGKSLVCVAKPHIASFKMAIEDLGFVGSGVTNADDYKHRYVNCRNLRIEEPEKYRLKRLNQTQSEALANKCLVLEPGKQKIIFEDDFDHSELEVLVMDLSGYSEQDEISPEVIDQLDAFKGSVITRVFQKGKKFVLVYEPERLHPEAKTVLDEAKKRFYNQRGY